MNGNQSTRPCSCCWCIPASSSACSQCSTRSSQLQSSQSERVQLSKEQRRGTRRSGGAVGCRGVRRQGDGEVSSGTENGLAEVLNKSEGDWQNLICKPGEGYIGCLVGWAIPYVSFPIFFLFLSHPCCCLASSEIVSSLLSQLEGGPTPCPYRLENLGCLHSSSSISFL